MFAKRHLEAHHLKALRMIELTDKVLPGDVRKITQDFGVAIHTSSLEDVDVSPMEVHTQATITELSLKGSNEILHAIQMCTVHIVEGLVKIASPLVAVDLQTTLRELRDDLEDTTPQSATSLTPQSTTSRFPKISMTLEVLVDSAEIVLERLFSSAGSAAWISFRCWVQSVLCGCSHVGCRCSGLVVEAVHICEERTHVSVHAAFCGEHLNGFTGSPAG